MFYFLKKETIKDKDFILFSIKNNFFDFIKEIVRNILESLYITKRIGWEPRLKEKRNGKSNLKLYQFF